MLVQYIYRSTIRNQRTSHVDLCPYLLFAFFPIRKGVKFGKERSGHGDQEGLFTKLHVTNSQGSNLLTTIHFTQYSTTNCSLQGEKNST